MLEKINNWKQKGNRLRFPQVE